MRGGASVRQRGPVYRAHGRADEGHPHGDLRIQLSCKLRLGVQKLWFELILTLRCWNSLQ